MKEWSIEFDVPHPLPLGETLGNLVVDLLRMLRRFSAVAAHDAVLLSVRMSVQAATAGVAISRARGALLTALRRVGFPGSPEITRIQVENVEQLERRLRESNVPELAGVAEVSKILKVSKQRVSELLKSKHFPRPITVLEASPVWRSATILRFAQDWERKPGRPAKIAVRYSGKLNR